ncbi:ABC transporter ATP-binding protein [Orrella marina]|uniref:ABC transporter n=1 Tax=Orrella marina TaxID=2163011 RepID=A0A2R4XFJ0_9BURK|nr:ABC transporter ATP-binding protein [Orrella marina]AWB32473.1 ABC transporter [Orrella marina]
MARLRVESLTKVYPSVIANEDVSLRVDAGEIHAVLGENGAGKSTLMKMIYGVTTPTRGKIFWEDEEIQIASPAQARALGIGMVFQHFSLFETLTVAQNTALSLPGHLSLSEVSRQITDVSERYGLAVNPDRYVHDLSVGERQRVEIIRCLLQKPRLLIMDEPTSVLTPAAVERLFVTLRQIRDEGCAILYISHKLDEIMTLCDHATVLRGGKVTGECIPANETPQSMARMMIGHDFDVPTRPKSFDARPLLHVRCDRLEPADPYGVSLKGVDLAIKGGQVLGIAGISGSGQEELCRLLGGETAVSQEQIVFDGEKIGHLGPRARRARGICYVPEDRQSTAALGTLTLAENALLTAADRVGLTESGMLKRSRIREFAKQCIEKFRVKAQGPEALAQSLSGGNLQKFIVGREMLQSPRVLICAQPTWGVDVGAAAFIRQQLIDLSRGGCAVIVLSEELDELFEVSDEICVIAGGEISPVRTVGQTSVEEIGTWMSGLWDRDSRDSGGSDRNREEVNHAVA